MKPWGKKKPASQKHAGWPVVAQDLMKATLASKSAIQLDRGLSEGYETARQFAGTLLLRRSVCMASRTADILMRPRMAS